MDHSPYSLRRLEKFQNRHSGEEVRGFKLDEENAKKVGDWIQGWYYLETGKLSDAVQDHELHGYVSVEIYTEEGYIRPSLRANVGHDWVILKGEQFGPMAYLLTETEFLENYGSDD